MEDVSILKWTATPLLSVRWGFETTSTVSLARHLNISKGILKYLTDPSTMAPHEK
jgi:hypothetical protein